MDGEFHRDPACVADTVADAPREIEVDAVARRQIAAGLRDADDRPSRAEFRRGETVVHEPLEIERGHVRARGVREPVTRSEGPNRLPLHAKLSCWAVAAQSAHVNTGIATIFTDDVKRAASASSISLSRFSEADHAWSARGRRRGAASDWRRISV
jgi:hypothetical protein